jgi:hypothetical protein
MADRVKEKGKSASMPAGILGGSGDASTMKGPIYSRSVDYTPKYREGSSNPKPGKSQVVG